MVDRLGRQHLLKIRLVGEGQFGGIDRGGITSIDMLETGDRHRLAKVEIDERVGPLTLRRVLRLHQVIEDPFHDKSSVGILFGFLNNLRARQRDDRRKRRRSLLLATAVRRERCRHSEHPHPEQGR